MIIQGILDINSSIVQWKDINYHSKQWYWLNRSMKGESSYENLPNPPSFFPKFIIITTTHKFYNIKFCAFDDLSKTHLSIYKKGTIIIHFPHYNSATLSFEVFGPFVLVCFLVEQWVREGAVRWWVRWWFVCCFSNILRWLVQPFILLEVLKAGPLMLPPGLRESASELAIHSVIFCIKHLKSYSKLVLI